MNIVTLCTLFISLDIPPSIGGLASRSRSRHVTRFMPSWWFPPVPSRGTTYFDMYPSLLYALCVMSNVPIETDRNG